ncbi:unnamed protein product [Blepharisma stoltei]|uniref:PLAC8 family protein n=1 Tax=Blepharisma stoltei TaxID=1481888 RepID=A0AAU9JLD9_9CILI|nr:unnamed protein product [Blepharisma stoltei]
MGGWRYTIFQCFDNPGMCLWACCVPCGMSCMQACDAKYSDPDNKNALITAFLCSCCLGCIGSVYNRYKLRKKLHVEDSILYDILFWCCCPCCSATQEWMTVFSEKKANQKVTIWELKNQA